MLNIFRKHKVTLLDEKWNVVQNNLKLQSIPRIHELMFLPKEGKYYRVVNVIYSLYKTIDTFVIIEQYTDDFKLLDEKK